MAAAPDGIRMNRHRDLTGRAWHPWVRRGLLGVVAAVAALALFNVFGQRPRLARAAGPAASLTVTAPTRIRSGLLYTAVFRVTARHELRKAFLVLDPGWFDGMQVNSVVPQGIGEASRDGRVAYALGHVPAGQTYLMYLSLQVNPTTIGSRRQNVELDDGPRRVATVRGSLTIFP